MAKNLGLRAAIVGLSVLGALVYLTPTLSGDLPGWWSGFLPQDKIHLGLDLQGGIHLVLEVKAEKAVENSLEGAIEAIKRDLREKRIRYKNLRRQGIEGIRVTLMRGSDRDSLENLVRRYYGDFELRPMPAEGGEPVFLLAYSVAAREETMRTAVDQALEKIRNRIDEKGLKEPDIRRKGAREIVIQIPGVDEREYKGIRALIEQQALLEFKLVDEDNSVQAAAAGNMPPGDQILYDRDTGRPWLLKKRTLLTGERIIDARVQFSQFNEPQVSLSFDKRGARIFEQITGKNVGKRLAIVLDNKVYSAPVIQDRIAGGRAQITGRFTDEEAKNLAIALRSGSLAAPVEILYENTVGPSLGKDSIEKGVQSMLIGGAIVILFMAVYYGLSGLIADVVLLLNIFFIMAGLAFFGATLTLPGIAGMILTVGMSVDANVLIFERIREESRLGKPPRASIDAGFGKALMTILDANITTLIAALVLFQFGTGPVRGFAVTLSLGIISSLFTAIFVSRIIFDYLYTKRRLRKLSI